MSCQVTMKVLLNIDVPDITEAVRFYTQAFGLQPARRFGEAALELLGAEAPIYLLLKTAGTTGAGGKPRDYERHWTPIHCDIVVDDLEAALAQAFAAGAQPEGAIREADWGRIVTLADPFGHGWCLLQFRGRGYDEITT